MSQHPYPARKRLGQHFLIDPHVIAQIVQAVAATSNDRLVEIGPGLGALTLPLCSACQEMHVVELDRGLIPRLLDLPVPPGKLHVHQMDALKLDLASLGDGRQSLRLLGNLPYNISTPLLFHLLAQVAHIRDMHFMLQKEVVERMAAEPGGKVYGRLSVMLQLYCQVIPLFEVQRDAFRPRPKVQSMVVRLVPWERPLVPLEDVSALNRVVRDAFSQRRKTLSNALARCLSLEQIRLAGINPKARAETLSLQEFIRLADALGPGIHGD